VIAGALEVRAFRDGDEAGIVEAMARDGGPRRSLDEWAWRYPPLPEGRPVVVALRAGKIVGHLGAAARRLEVEGREVAAAALCDGFVEADAEDDGGRLRSWMTAAFLEAFGPGRRFDLVYWLDATDDTHLDVGDAPTGSMARAAVQELVRRGASSSPVRRLAYRAEPSRDWEPRLDGLWRRAVAAHPTAAVRDAQAALAEHAGHPTRRWHRFLVLPRFSARAAAFVVFEGHGDALRWVDLLWDHHRPGALDLVLHLSGLLARQLEASHESVLVGGDPELVRRLSAAGFAAATATPAGRLMVLASTLPLSADELSRNLYLTRCDLETS
jgi:hypothetical protein